MSSLRVVYFDQLLGASCTPNMVKILFWLISDFVLLFSLSRRLGSQKPRLILQGPKLSNDSLCQVWPKEQLKYLGSVLFDNL